MNTKTKKIMLLMIVLAAVLILAGCDAISGAFDSVFLNATEVKASDLKNYSGTPADSSDDVAAGFSTAMGAVGEQASARSLFGDDADEVVNVLRYSSPEANALLTAGDSESRSLTAGANVSIIDETIDDSGSEAQIQIDELSFSGDLEFNKMDNPTSAKVNFDGKGEVGASNITGYDYDIGNYTVVDSQLNFNANGNAEATMDASTGAPTSISYYLGVDMSIGFTLDCDGYSGKYIVNAKYVNNADWTTGDTSVTGGESIEIVVTAYDNNGGTLASKTYTAEQFFAVAMEAAPSS